ncbi:MAG: YhcH/YjgK/YiaL family protein [Bacteroidaceae bacterium]|nr:YhcH/YjgK/YiaL family protein [Bacteroidaceae bacterium]
MIIDTIENLNKYASVNPLFNKVVDFIKDTDLSKHPQGKVELSGKDLIANFTIAKGKTPTEAKIETHNKMIDIQIPLSCPETMGYTPRKDLEPQTYNEEKDIMFYEGLAQQYITITPGMFVIFFPEDGHAPCVSSEESIQKVIFKIKA